MATTNNGHSSGTIGSRSYPAGTTRQRAVLIPTDGPAEQIGLTADAGGLQAAIGCALVDVLSLDGGIDLWIDEEGLLTASPQLNLAASLLAHAGGIHTLIFGTAIALSVDQTTGETLGLSPAEAEHVLTVISGPADATTRATAVTLMQLLRPARSS